MPFLDFRIDAKTRPDVEQHLYRLKNLLPADLLEKIAYEIAENGVCLLKDDSPAPFVRVSASVDMEDEVICRLGDWFLPFLDVEVVFPSDGRVSCTHLWRSSISLISMLLKVFYRLNRYARDHCTTCSRV